MLGYFNLPTLKWNADMFSKYVSPVDMLFFNTFASVGLTQTLREGTFFPAEIILDLSLVLDQDSWTFHSLREQ